MTEQLALRAQSTPPPSPSRSNAPSSPFSPPPVLKSAASGRAQLPVEAEQSGGVAPADSVSDVNNDRSIEIVKKTSEIGFYCMGFAALAFVGAIGKLYLCRKRVWAYPVFFVEGIFSTGLGIYGFINNEIAIAEAKAVQPQQKVDFGSNITAQKDQPVGIMKYDSYLPWLIAFFQCIMNLSTMKASLKKHIDDAKEFTDAFEGFYRANLTATSPHDVKKLCKILVVLSSDDQLVKAIQSETHLSVLAEYLVRFKEALDQNTQMPLIAPDSYETLCTNLNKIRLKKYTAHFERIKNALFQDRGRLEVLENAMVKYEELQNSQNLTASKMVFAYYMWRDGLYHNHFGYLNKFLKDFSPGLEAHELLNSLLGKKFGPRTPDLFLEKMTENNSQSKREWSSYLSLDIGHLEGEDGRALLQTIRGQIATAPECLILKLDRYSGQNPNQSSIIMPEVFELKGFQYQKKCYIMRERRDLNSFSAYIRKDNQWWYCSDRDIQIFSGHGEYGYLYFYERSRADSRSVS